MKSLIAAAAAGLALAGWAAQSQAAPAVGGLKAAIADEARLVQKTHGFHRYCRLGRYGWHRHGPYGGRIPCRPPRRLRY